MWADPVVHAFFASFGLTGVALAAALALGRTRRIRAHVALVVTFLALFAVTIAFAEWVGRRYTFDATARTIHLPAAVLGALSAAAPVATGWRRLRGHGSLRAHRIAIVVFLVAFVLATTTGVAMLATGTPRAS